MCSRCWSPIQAPKAALVEVLSARLRETDRHLAEAASLPVPARLAMAVLRQGENVATVRSGARLRLSQRELASLIGASRERVNKFLREWQRIGIIGILNRDALESLSQPEYD
jgi:CRP/FNR family cyclic AMP-dependent transcriptional regulator